MASPGGRGNETREVVEQSAGVGQSEDKNQTWQLVMSRGKRYTVHEYNTEDEEPSGEDENFQFKDQAELEKITEEGYGQDYEDGLWEDPNATPSSESTSEIPDDYDSADYEDKRREEDVSGADTSGSVERSEEATSEYDDYDDDGGSNESSGGKTSVGSISGDHMKLDEFGFPVFEKYEDVDVDLRRWTKRDTMLAQGPDYDYGGYNEDVETTSAPKPVLTTTEAPPAQEPPESPNTDEESTT